MSALLHGGVSTMLADLKELWLEKKVGIRPFFSELNGKGLKNMLYIQNTKQQHFRDVDNDLTWKKCVCILYFAPLYYITVQI